MFWQLGALASLFHGAHPLFLEPVAEDGNASEEDETANNGYPNNGFRCNIIHNRRALNFEELIYILMRVLRNV